MAALTPRKISLCSDYLYIYVYIHVYTCIHIGATYIEIHISWGRDDRRVYLFTPTPLLIPIFTEYNRGRVKICIESILLNSIGSPSLSIYIYILKKERGGGGIVRADESFIGMDIPSFVEYYDDDGKYELRGKVAVGRVGHSSSSSPRDDVSRQLY